MKQARSYILIIICAATCIAGFSTLIFQQESILRKYFISDPQERMDKFKESLSGSLGKYFIKENRNSGPEEVADYIKRFGRTSLFELVFIFRDKDGSMKEISRSGVTPVTYKSLAGENVYPTTIDGGRTEGYLMVIIKETGESEFEKGLKKYIMISYSLRFLFFLLIAALSMVLFYHYYSAKMKLARDIAEARASNDGLTGLHTHEYFGKMLNIEVEKFRIYHTPLALLMLDIDHFKDFNDKYGHPAGDKILEIAANIIKLSTRATDILARYGGEEFAIVIPYVKTDAARDKDALKDFIREIENIAERIRKNAEDYKAEFLPQTSHFTISIGVSFCYKRSDTITGATLLEKADKALYEAKRLGRNRVYIDYESAA